MIMCPNCKKSGVDLIDRDEEKGTLKYQCCYCDWTEMGFITHPNTMDADYGDNRMILMIPENSGLGTKKLAPIGNSQHVIIDRRMMNAAGVKIGDLIHVVIWKSISKYSKEREDHE